MKKTKGTESSFSTLKRALSEGERRELSSLVDQPQTVEEIPDPPPQNPTMASDPKPPNSRMASNLQTPRPRNGF